MLFLVFQTATCLSVLEVDDDSLSLFGHAWDFRF